MKKIIGFTFFVFVVSVTPTCAQGAKKFLFDPVFWAPDLKLSAQQQRKITEINSQFYTQLKSKPTQESLQEYLEARNTQILETFHPRQRKRWEKIAGGL